VAGVLGAGVVGAAVATLIGLPVLRRRGLTIAVVTLSFSLATTAWLLSPQFFGEGHLIDWLPPSRIERPDVFGLVDVSSETSYYFLCLVALAVAVVVVRVLRRSAVGRVSIAVRENELAANSFGVNSRATTLLAFAISGFLAAFAGALFVHQQHGLELSRYSAGESLVVFSMVVIGGLASIPGALLGAFYVRGVTWALPVDWQALATGAGLLVVLLLFPGGLGAAFADLRDLLLRRVARRRGIATWATGPVTPAPGPPVPTIATAAPEARGAVLSVRGLEVAYDGVPVLFGVDLDVEPGEVVALLGTNGSGKSTVLRAVAGLVTPRRGSVVVDGDEVTRAPAYRIATLGVGLAPGGEGVFPSLTVAEHLRLAAWTVREPRAAVADVLEWFPLLATRSDERAGDLSGGEQQLLTLAMTLVARPHLLLVDELTLGLAPAVVEHVIALIAELRASGTTVLVVDQSLDLARRVADRCYFLERGTVQFVGTPDELASRTDLVRAVFLAPPHVELASKGGAIPRLSTQVGVEGVARLVVRGVSKHYGGVVALDDVTFSVGAGEIVGLIGANGAGKTTLFDVVSGFTRADGGTIELAGDGPVVDVARLPAYARARRGLGRSFQDGRLFPALTVRETVAVACRRDASVDELLALVSLDEYRDAFVHELSTGTRRIVDVACALGHRPSVLLLDEPSSGLAQAEAEALAPVLTDVRDRLGASLLVIEHDVPLLRSVAERLVALDLGRVVASGPTDEVLRDPAVSRAFGGLGA
jgi:ABC-type branched-subunit amino acid transport system ATPase component/ABC-type branched-subunit amino acid transport system permease subunit